MGDYDQGYNDGVTGREYDDEASCPEYCAGFDVGRADLNERTTREWREGR